MKKINFDQAPAILIVDGFLCGCAPVFGGCQTIGVKDAKKRMQLRHDRAGEQSGHERQGNR
jgi:hypothetical protein